MAWQPSAQIATLQQRAEHLNTIRRFFSARQVVEVQTPVLGRYSVTDTDVGAIEVAGYGFLQTSPEYFMKRLLAAGMPDCFQLGPAFRHAESGRYHNPEFTMLEWYRLGYDDQQLMLEVAQLVDCVLGPGEVKRLTYAELVYEGVVNGRRCAVDAPRQELDLAFADACAELAPGRFFITDYPSDQAALARLRPSPTAAAAQHAASAARFEMVIDGIEIANGYWELNDHNEHARRFAADNQSRLARGLPQQQVDAEFMAALRHGLPDCAGVALGFDRLLMLALGLSHIHDVLAFPRQPDR